MDNRAVHHTEGHAFRELKVANDIKVTQPSKKVKPSLSEELDMDPM